jgi:hypothetical protein
LIAEPTGSAPVEERTDIPRAHAQALLEVCGGQITIERSTLAIAGGAEVLVERITHPGVLTSVAVEFHNPDEAEAFTPPVWFGPEITAEPSFRRQVIAFDRMPEVGEVPLSSATVDALLDVLEGRAPVEPPAPSFAPHSSIDTSVLDALRRLSIGRPTPGPAGHEEASPEHRMPDIDASPTPVQAAEPLNLATGDEASPAEDGETSTSNIERLRSRLFPRLTH